MSNVLHLLVNLDQDAIRATTELRWGAATPVLALASAWWVKGPLLVATGWCADLRSRRLFPLVALAATASFFIASALNAVTRAWSTGAARPSQSTSTRSSECPRRRRSRPATR